MLTYCDLLHNKFTHEHCCTYFQGIFHQVDVVRINNAFDTVECVYPTLGDNVSGFYGLDRRGRNLIRMVDVPRGMLQTMCKLTFRVLFV